MRIAKETTSSFKPGSTTKGPKGIAVAARNPAQMRGRTNPKGAGHAVSGRAGSIGRKPSTGKGSAK